MIHIPLTAQFDRGGEAGQFHRNPPGPGFLKFPPVARHRFIEGIVTRLHRQQHRRGPEALGQGYHFRDTGGIAMEYRLETRAQLDELAPEAAVPERLRYVSDALTLIKKELAGTKALLGFGGSPWTLATYMVEGGSSEDFERINVKGKRPWF